MHVMLSDICCRSCFYLNTDIGARRYCWCVIVISYCRIVEMNRCSLLLLVVFSSMRNHTRHDQKHDVQNIHLAFRHSKFPLTVTLQKPFGLAYQHITNSQMQFPAMPSPSPYKICDKRTHCIYVPARICCMEKMPGISTNIRIK